MDKQKVILFAVLIIFVVGMTMSCATAKTVTIKPKKDKYAVKKKGKYKVEAMKWQAYTYQEVDIMAYKHGKMMKNTKYSSKVYYKENGKWKNTGWHKGGHSCTYHKYFMDKKHKIGKVKVRI
ncbi:hypothetical protein [Methanobrevibacter sp.]|uniref:hypothetical protein n=1 Tax=Methanobrevibacter sp. TaxID=66852 RepID=UPI0025ECF418|nr:hypothetical protein [Methanobrevibacter sp.]MBR4448269.1 hypothetical protein [Methanobrevibacter sp.]